MHGRRAAGVQVGGRAPPVAEPATHPCSHPHAAAAAETRPHLPTSSLMPRLVRRRCSTTPRLAVPARTLVHAAHACTVDVPLDLMAWLQCSPTPHATQNRMPPHLVSAGMHGAAVHGAPAPRIHASHVLTRTSQTVIGCRVTRRTLLTGAPLQRMHGHIRLNGLQTKASDAPHGRCEPPARAARRGRRSAVSLTVSACRAAGARPRLPARRGRSPRCRGRARMPPAA